MSQFEKTRNLSGEMNFMWILLTIASLKSKSLQELRLNFYNYGGDFFLFDVHSRCLKNVLKKMTENFPNIQYFRLALDVAISPIYKEICREIASEEKIKIEIRNTRDDSKHLFG